jgi:hypothetical protein
MLASKLAEITPSGSEAENSIFQYKLALSKLSADLTKIQESFPGLLLNATVRLHQAVRKLLLRNFRYTTLVWHSKLAFFLPRWRTFSIGHRLTKLLALLANFRVWLILARFA